MTNDEAITKLDALTGHDPEVAHGEADEVLLAVAPRDVAAAWQRAADRVGFWYA